MIAIIGIVILIIIALLYYQHQQLIEKYKGKYTPEQIWFAWRPVRSGALGTGHIIWLRWCWRDTAVGIYQELGEYVGQQICTWTQDKKLEWNLWETECGEAFFLEDGTPTDNKMRYCPFCGSELKELNREN